MASTPSHVSLSEKEKGASRICYFSTLLSTCIPWQISTSPSTFCPIQSVKSSNRIHSRLNVAQKAIPDNIVIFCITIMSNYILNFSSMFELFIFNNLKVHYVSTLNCD